MSTNYDAIVIGGGPAGSAAALLLARAGWCVALLERKEFPRRKVCGEYLSATNLPLLDDLGVGAVFRASAGAPVERVGLFAGQTVLSATLPRLGHEWGRALGREHLDTLLIDEARRAGAVIRQPCAVTALHEADGLYQCATRATGSDNTPTLTAPVIVAAHGSWDAGTLPTQPKQLQPTGADLFGFKARFSASALPGGLMPLLAFPGGYGGMVHSDGGRISLSCCVRRDQLNTIRAKRAGDAGAAVQAHIEATCAGAAQVLLPAHRDGPWLAAGPIRPGIRLHGAGGIFPVGNAAGEAHPVIAEGISIALQSAWLLARFLVPWRDRGGSRAALGSVGAAYTRAWRHHFSGRLYAAQAIAHWAMRPWAVNATLPLLHCFPALLNWSSRLSGKARVVVRTAAAP